jgi:hypothetical protein
MLLSWRVLGGEPVMFLVEIGARVVSVTLQVLSLSVLALGIYAAFALELDARKGKKEAQV